MCPAPDPDLRRVLEEIREQRLAARGLPILPQIRLSATSEIAVRQAACKAFPTGHQLTFAHTEWASTSHGEPPFGGCGSVAVTGQEPKVATGSFLASPLVRLAPGASPEGRRAEASSRRGGTGDHRPAARRWNQRVAAVQVAVRVALRDACPGRCRTSECARQKNVARSRGRQEAPMRSRHGAAADADAQVPGHCRQA